MTNNKKSKTHIRLTKNMGRGVFASKNLKKGEIVETSPCILLNPGDETPIDGTIVRFYVFKATENRSAIALGIGSLFNHRKAHFD